MASYTKTWTINQTDKANSTDIAHGGPFQHDFVIATAGYYTVLIQLRITTASGTTNGPVRIELFGSATGGADSFIDTRPVHTFDVPFAGSGVQQQIISFEIEGPWVRVKGTNLTGIEVDLVEWRYAGSKQTSA